MEKIQVLIKTIEKMAQFMRDYLLAKCLKTLVNFSFMQIQMEILKVIELLIILSIRHWRKTNETLCRVSSGMAR